MARDRGLHEMAYLFLIAVLGTFYSYLLYPLLLKLFRPVPVNGGELSRMPSMTIVIAARNSESSIAAKLDDVKFQEYDRAKLDIIVVSDSSDDNTDAIVETYSGDGIRLLRMEPRQGKEAAQSYALSQSEGEVVVFTDVATRMSPGSLVAIAQALASPDIGAVSSEDEFDSDSGSGEGAYVRYEMALRRLESERGGLCGLSGSFFAARRDVCDNWRHDIPSDFAVAISCAQRKMRSISVPDVRGRYPDLHAKSDEFARKRRTILRGMWALAKNAEVLSIPKFGIFAFQIWSHKVMRWAVPWFMLSLACLTAVLWRENVLYAVAGILQLAGYGMALLAALFSRARQFRLLRLAYYFAQVNLAAAFAAVDLLRGRQVVMWEPSKR